jgi:hypothetical protein
LLWAFGIGVSGCDMRCYDLEGYCTELLVDILWTSVNVLMHMQYYCRLEHPSENDKCRNVKYSLRANTAKLYRTVVCIAFPLGMLLSLLVVFARR